MFQPFVAPPSRSILANRDDMKAARDMLHTVRDRRTQFSKKGATLDQAIHANPVIDLDAKWGKGFLSGESFLRMAYPSIAKHEDLVKSRGMRHVGW